MRTERRFAGRYSPMTCGFEPWKACSAGVTTRAFAKGIGFQQRAGAGGDTRATSLPCRQQVQINNGKAHPVCAKRWQSQMR
jgi:hypothetical protein